MIAVQQRISKHRITCVRSVRLLTLMLVGLGGATASTTVDGIWRSEGWGLVYNIHGSTLQSFEVTTTTCVLGFKAKQISSEQPGIEATFRTSDGDLFQIVGSSDQSHKRIVQPTALATIGVQRLSTLPKVCSSPTENTPSGNFRVFAKTFSENYISFDRRGVDWNRVVHEEAKKVDASTPPKELFDILAEMIAPLTDIHTGIQAPKLKRHFDAHLRPGTDRVIKGNIDRFASSGRRELSSITDRKYFHRPLKSFCHGQWQYGITDSGIGYLRILSFGDYARHGALPTSLRAIDGALDKILGDPEVRALIIDVRLSFGGDDQLGLAIATRLTAHEYPAYAIQARSDPDDSRVYTAPQRVMVRPGKQPRFNGRVIELIGPITMSAAETFTEALMERTPHVVRIGENTQGVFCDVLDRHLPNGWTFVLPNAVYRLSDGKAFDVSGIPPDIEVPVFADHDVAAGLDPAMDEAIRIVQESRGT
jgi:hypothetical protein